MDHTNHFAVHIDIDGSATILFPNMVNKTVNPLLSPEPTSISVPDTGAEMYKIPTQSRLDQHSPTSKVNSGQ
jgi:hypothetical protein